MRDVWPNIQPLEHFLFFIFQSKFPITFSVEIRPFFASWDSPCVLPGGKMGCRQPSRVQQTQKCFQQTWNWALLNYYSIPVQYQWQKYKNLMQFPGGIFLVCFCDITIPYTTHRKSAQKTNIIIHLQVCLQNQCLVSLKRRCCSLLSWADTQQCSCFYARRFIYSNFNILHILVSCLIKLSPFMRRPSNQMNPSPAVSLLPNMLLLLHCTKSLVSCICSSNGIWGIGDF